MTKRIHETRLQTGQNRKNYANGFNTIGTKLLTEDLVDEDRKWKNIKISFSKQNFRGAENIILWNKNENDKLTFGNEQQNGTIEFVWQKNNNNSAASRLCTFPREIICSRPSTTGKYIDPNKFA